MMVTFISQCEKNALKKTRRVLVVDRRTGGLENEDNLLPDQYSS